MKFRLDGEKVYLKIWSKGPNKIDDSGKGDDLCKEILIGGDNKHIDDVPRWPWLRRSL